MKAFSSDGFFHCEHCKPWWTTECADEMDSHMQAHGAAKFKADVVAWIAERGYDEVDWNHTRLGGLCAAIESGSVESFAAEREAKG